VKEDEAVGPNPIMQVHNCMTMYQGLTVIESFKLAYVNLS
jgi:hypothetical protein